MPTHDDPDPSQLQLFSDPKTEALEALVSSLIENGEKIRELHEATRKTLLGRRGYARPEYIKQIRAHRRKLGPGIGGIAVSTQDSQPKPLRRGSLLERSHSKRR